MQNAADLALDALKKIATCFDDSWPIGGIQRTMAMLASQAVTEIEALPTAHTDDIARDAARLRALVADPGPLWNACYRALGTDSHVDQGVRIRALIDARHLGNLSSSGVDNVSA